MLRSLEKRIRPPSETVSAEVWKRVKSFKARMARIRAPLAKLTPTTGFAHVDEVPRGACVVNNAKDKGWCWQLNATTYVWRHDLGDELLWLLDGFPNPWAEKRND